MASLLVERLSIICLKVIAENWQNRPLFSELLFNENINILIDHLSVDLPFDFAVSQIHDDNYWKKSFKFRWPNSLVHPKPIDTVVDYEKLIARHEAFYNEDVVVNWKRYYVENHIEEYLENVQPENYNPEHMNEMCEIAREYIDKLEIKHMQAPYSQDRRDRIALDKVLGALNNIKELSISFNQISCDENFKWEVLKTSMSDIKNLAVGIGKLNLRKLRLRNSDMDCAKCTIIADACSTCKDLVELDMAHCKIALDGTTKLCETMISLDYLQVLNLENNFLDSNCAIKLTDFLKAYGRLVKLDISLNKIGSIGGDAIAESLIAHPGSLLHLAMAGCGLDANAKSIATLIAVNRSLATINLNNNRFGEEIGRAMAQGLEESNRTLVRLDVRMCRLLPQTEFQIRCALDRNRFLMRKSTQKLVYFSY